MIPIRDTVRSRSFPIATLVIVALNAYVFFLELSQGSHLEAFIRHWGLVPRAMLRWHALGGLPLDPRRFAPLVTSMFLHGGWGHILGNMLYLWVFGGHLEDRLGHLRFVVFYLLAGLAAALTQIWAAPFSTMPVVGASGAIAGVLGGYFVAYPRARILTLIPIIILPWFVEIPAIVFLGVWFVMQLLSGTAELGVATAQTAGVAWWAHAGGFLSGIALVLVMPKRVYRRWLSPEY